MQPKIRRFLKLSAGWGFIVLGVAGLILPFLQGILFLLIGLFLLSHELPWADRLLTRVKLRFPKWGKKIDEAEAFVMEIPHLLVHNPKALLKHFWILVLVLLTIVGAGYGAYRFWHEYRNGNLEKFFHQALDYVGALFS